MDDNSIAFTTSAPELIRVIRNAIPFACTDDTLPVICAIQFKVENGEVEVTATDRYTLSTESLGASRTDGEGYFMLGIDDAKRLVSANRHWARRGNDGPATVTYDSCAGKIAFDAGHLGAVIVASWDDPARFPRTGYLWRAKDGDDAPSYSVGFTPAMLARFAKVTPREGKDTPMLMVLNGASADSTRCVHVLMGDHFKAAVATNRGSWS